MPGRKYPLVTKVTTPRGDSYPMTSFVTQKTFDSVVSYEPDDDDVFVCSYPKNGTTWSIYILHLLRSGCSGFSKGEQLNEHYACLDFLGGEKTKAYARPRLVQTHLRSDLMPMNKLSKYIFVARNPKDVVTSFYYHTLGFDFYDFADGKFDDFFEHFMRGEHDFGDYFEMVPAWWQESKKRENVHFVLYEDLKSDFEKELLKIADFLGGSYRAQLLANGKELLNAITHKADIKTMKGNVKHIMSMKRPEHLPFTRKGVIGDWKHLLSKEQSDLIDEKMMKCGEKYPGFDRLWDEYKEFL